MKASNLVGVPAFCCEAPAHSGMLGCAAGGKTGLLVQSPVADGCQSFVLFLFFDWLNGGHLFSSLIGHPPPEVSEGRAGRLVLVCLSLLVVAAGINISACAYDQRCNKRAVRSQYERITLRRKGHIERFRVKPQINETCTCTELFKPQMFF